MSNLAVKSEPEVKKETLTSLPPPSTPTAASRVIGFLRRVFLKIDDQISRAKEQDKRIRKLKEEAQNKFPYPHI